MAQLIVDRTTLVNHLLQRHHPDSDRAHAVLAGLLRLFMNYLSSAQQPHGEAYSWVCTAPSCFDNYVNHPSSWLLEYNSG